MEHMLSDVVLLVDSDKERLSAIQSVLQREGYAVLSSPNVVSALKQVQQTLPSVIFLDTALFDAGGIEFIGILKKHYGRRISFVILTTGCDETTLAKLAGFEINSFLDKPVKTHELLGLVRLNFDLIRKKHRINAADLEPAHQTDETNRFSQQLSILQKAIDIAAVGVMIIDTGMKINYVNQAQSAMFCTKPQEMTGKYLYDYMPGQYCTYSDEKVHRSEQIVFNKEGGYIHMQIVSDMVMDDKDEPSAYIYCCVDITRIKEMEKELFVYSGQLQDMVDERTQQLRDSNTALVASLNEKEILLKEVHHRVRNNLQIISSMINLSVANVSDPQSLSVLKSSYSRVKAMTLLHDRLYDSSDMASVEVAGYIEALSGELINSYGYPQSSVVVHTNIASLSINIMMQCGLILNELISNSLRHGFTKERPGEIVITLNLQDDGSYILIVSDNGMGFDAATIKIDTYTGLKLIQDIVKMKLKGSITIESSTGTTVTINFKDVGGRYHNKL
ncbi:MAG: response regulator [Nitrospirae bacterium YQR-1]